MEILLTIIIVLLEIMVVFGAFFLGYGLGLSKDYDHDDK